MFSWGAPYSIDIFFFSFRFHCNNCDVLISKIGQKFRLGSAHQRPKTNQTGLDPKKLGPFWYALLLVTKRSRSLTFLTGQRVCWQAFSSISMVASCPRIFKQTITMLNQSLFYSDEKKIVPVDAPFLHISVAIKETSHDPIGTMSLTAIRWCRYGIPEFRQ